MRQGQFIKLVKQLIPLSILFGIMVSYQNCRKASTFSSSWSGPSAVAPIVDVFANVPECSQIDGKFVIPYNSNTTGTNNYKVDQGYCRINSNVSNIAITFQVPKIDSKDIFGRFVIKISQKPGSGKESCGFEAFDTSDRGGSLLVFNASQGDAALSGVTTFNFETNRPVDFGPNQNIEKYIFSGVPQLQTDGYTQIQRLNTNSICNFTETLVSTVFTEATFITPSEGIPQNGPESLAGYSPVECPVVETDKLNITLFSTDIFGGSLSNKPCKINETIVGDTKHVKFKVNKASTYKVLFYLPQNLCNAAATCSLGLNGAPGLTCNTEDQSKDLGLTRNFGGVQYKVRYLETNLNSDFDSGLCWDSEGGNCPYECAKSILMLYLPKDTSP